MRSWDVAPEQAATMLDVDAARLLKMLMGEISESYYCAGWLGGLECCLWEMVQGGSRGFGMGTVSESEVSELDRLSQKAGGWWVWDDTAVDERFLTLDEWREVYAREWQR